MKRNLFLKNSQRGSTDLKHKWFLSSPINLKFINYLFTIFIVEFIAERL